MPGPGNAMQGLAGSGHWNSAVYMARMERRMARWFDKGKKYFQQPFYTPQINLFTNWAIHTGRRAGSMENYTILTRGREYGWHEREAWKFTLKKAPEQQDFSWIQHSPNGRKFQLANSVNYFLKDQIFFKLLSKKVDLILNKQSWNFSHGSPREMCEEEERLSKALWNHPKGFYLNVSRSTQFTDLDSKGIFCCHGSQQFFHSDTHDMTHTRTKH